MGINMGDVFKKMFPHKPEEVISAPPEVAEKIHKKLIANLAAAQEEYERNFRPPNPEAMNQIIGPPDAGPDE